MKIWGNKERRSSGNTFQQSHPPVVTFKNHQQHLLPPALNASQGILHREGRGRKMFSSHLSSTFRGTLQKLLRRPCTRSLHISIWHKYINSGEKIRQSYCNMWKSPNMNLLRNIVDESVLQAVRQRLIFLNGDFQVASVSVMKSQVVTQWTEHHDNDVNRMACPS